MIIGNCVSSARPVHKLSVSLLSRPLLLPLLLPPACMEDLKLRTNTDSSGSRLFFLPFMQKYSNLIANLKEIVTKPDALTGFTMRFCAMTNLESDTIMKRLRTRGLVGIVVHRNTTEIVPKL